VSTADAAEKDAKRKILEVCYDRPSSHFESALTVSVDLMRRKTPVLGGSIPNRNSEEYPDLAQNMVSSRLANV